MSNPRCAGWRPTSSQDPKTVKEASDLDPGIVVLICPGDKCDDLLDGLKVPISSRCERVLLQDPSLRQHVPEALRQVGDFIRVPFHRSTVGQ